MLKIGLTGGISVGKTNVANWFAARKVTVFDADKTVHQFYSTPSVTEKIRKSFGPEYLLNNTIDRTLLASKVFQDGQAKAKLEEILHPLVIKEMQTRCAQAESEQEKLIILDIPLLFEAGWENHVDEVWVVYVPRAIQIQRLMLRNNLSREESQSRICSQMPLEEKVKKADRVIDNSGSWQETEQQLGEIWKELKKKLGL